MANDLATLKSRLAVALRDPNMVVWPTAELTDLLNSATAQLYPRVAVPMSLPVYPLVADQEDYDLPSGILEVSRVDLARVSDDRLLFPLPSGTWEIYGDVWSLTAKLFINASYADADNYLVVHGYGVYDLTNSNPPDIYVPFILATARAEAWRTMIGLRSRFEQWMALNQKENVSVNELAQMISMAEGEAERQRARMKTWRKPKPAR